MDVSIHLNSRIDSPLAKLPKPCSPKKHSKINTIACRAPRWAIGSGTNYYKVLSLDSENVSADEIKKAYRSMALQYHPDVCPPSRKEESTRIFIELQKAYETLSDPILRNRYDYELGLIDSMGRRRGINEERLGFSKEVLENQLCELKRRSNERMERKKNVYM
ncbi:chaperone protein dnaJ 20, chloroplastic-like [Magnolia sinica]|uniref:chaperone protein dnaJ 20, chloroplastic-like n=1 Tax=Magnolia sinica TaxID=86752 RepID=UPI00265A827E|nr:chaperone protein dnaJ 20, chloroplastic-like [Magnolia sinica]